jgi:hypothetical protein
MNTTTTAVSPEIVTYLNERIVKMKAWIAEDPQHRGGGCVEPTPEYLEELAREGVFTLNDYLRYELAYVVYDAHKSAWGWKPNYAKLRSMSMEELQQELEYCKRQFRANEERVKEAMDIAWAEANELASRLGQSVKTLIKWGVLDKRELYPA